MVLEKSSLGVRFSWGLRLIWKRLFPDKRLLMISASTIQVTSTRLSTKARSVHEWHNQAPQFVFTIYRKESLLFTSSTMCFVRECERKGMQSPKKCIHLSPAEHITQYLTYSQSLGQLVFCIFAQRNAESRFKMWAFLKDHYKVLTTMLRMALTDRVNTISGWQLDHKRVSNNRWLYGI